MLQFAFLMDSILFQLCFNVKTSIRPRKYIYMYRNDLKFSDRLIWANSADPDQTSLFAIQFASF